MGKIIGIVSLKGGAGKTSVVASLGFAFSEIGKKVLLIDGNLSSPSLGLHLNIIDPEKTLHHVLNRIVNPRDAIYECEEGFNIMPSSIFERTEVSPLKLKNRIKGLKRSYDIILIDSSPSLDEETLAVMLASDEILVVTTPDHPTLSATMKAIKLAKQRGTPISGLILLAVIPYDLGVLKSLSKMKPYTSHNPKSKGSIEYKKLASALLGQKYKQTKLKNFFGKITPKKQEINREIFYNRVFK
jgi:septum site-determining protein MinD